MEWLKKFGWTRTGLWSATPPVFHHSLGWDGKKVDGDVYTIPARCGLALDQWNRETGQRFHSSQMVNRIHLDKFARPCRRCYPEAS